MKKLLVIISMFALCTTVIVVAKSLKKQFDPSLVDTSGGIHE